MEVLRDAGYAVIEAKDGSSGLEALRTAVCVDLLMRPGAARPDLRILFITGYAENAAVRNGLLDPGMDVIIKPFGVRARCTKVHDMLDSRER